MNLAFLNGMLRIMDDRYVSVFRIYIIADSLIGCAEITHGFGRHIYIYAQAATRVEEMFLKDVFIIEIIFQGATNISKLSM